MTTFEDIFLGLHNIAESEVRHINIGGVISAMRMILQQNVRCFTNGLPVS